MIITSREALREFLARSGGTLSLDLETTGLRPYDQDQVVGLALLDPLREESIYVPMRHLLGTNAPTTTLLELAGWLADPGHTLIGFNFWGFDAHFLEQEGLAIDCRVQDGMLWAHLVNENEQSFALKRLADAHLPGGAGKAVGDLHRALSERDLDMGGLAKLSVEEVAAYAERDVALAAGIVALMGKRLKEQSLWNLAQEVDIYARAIHQMVRRGVFCDVRLCEERLAFTEAKAKAVLKEAVEARLLPAGFNPASSPQVCAFFKVPNADKVTIEALSRRGDVNKMAAAKAILEYRSWDKVASSFYASLLEMVDCNHRIHPSLSLIGTVTGRLACRQPNLQGLPRTVGETYRVRDVIVAPRGYSLVSLDYSQIEMRVAAHYANERAMIEILKSGKDVHQATADLVDTERDSAKRVNFGIIYGIGAEALALNITAGGRECSKEEAAGILYRFHAAFPRFRAFLAESEGLARRQGHVRMWTGRLRHYGQSDEYRRASSNLIQGGVAELMRVAITRLAERLPEARMLLQVHDEILFEVPDSDLEEFIPNARAIMQEAMSLGDLPIVTEVKVGPSWGVMKPWMPSRLF